jgi:hypothetical protein
MAKLVLCLGYIDKGKADACYNGPSPLKCSEETCMYIALTVGVFKLV